MIIGIIPVGGKGTRLGLSFSKEMLPQKNYDYYNPVMNHLVEKMEMAGAQKIFFVHGLEIKRDIENFFTGETYFHITQTELGFAKVLNAVGEILAAYDPLQSADKILFGLPDSVFDGNPFVEMLLKPGIVCGLFTTDDYSKVDRLNLDNTAFQVKTPKTDNNTDWFWGLIKFDGDVFKQVSEQAKLTNEVGDILNQHTVKFVKGKRYLDLGTWVNYNRYLSDTHSFSNIELEKKYNATNVDIVQFCEVAPKYFSNYFRIKSTDYYYTNNNPNIEFIRYREPSDDEGAVGDITIKNFRNSQLNRFELTIKLEDPITQNVIQFLNLLDAKFEFEVTKDCHIFTSSNATIVLYTFEVESRKFKIIEIELHTSDMNVLTDIEQRLAQDLDGFDPNNSINVSKYQLIKQAMK